MNILVFNCGSSSLNFKIFKVENLVPDNIEIILSGKAHRVGVIGSEPSFFIEYHFAGNDQKKVIDLNNHREAASLVLNYIKDNNISIDYIGHRFVHGGNFFKKVAFINKENLKKLKLCEPLATIHNPIALSVILESKKQYPKVLQYVSFDSAFHSTLPYYAYTYLLPKKIIEKFQYRKYGFHGLSYSYVIKAVAQFLKNH